MNMPTEATFEAGAKPTIFVVNVIHAHPGMQDAAYDVIKDVVDYVSERRKGFVWSTLAKSVDGETVVNVEAIASEESVEGEFFADDVFSEKFAKLKEVSRNEFHIYRVEDLIFNTVPGYGIAKA
ncbi:MULTISPECIES: antibiotic biosynthesis monooxygenase family protein [Roseovarius]|uniref:antibiotic biosynthesis monooxygenase family protein n=1 Tax=Roseovarius TaxID=74030 RepID=UPI001C93BD98|nr:hypothetical protein [Roseovarius atlanticus]MBY5989131.1 hypothetical protein [Roseovarius atlanticus]MBY6124523.1 hypothetical protein [Roseovarius atlanticus]MBY6149018.1 hypothetical protein [Roseovarius atlanticus]